MNDQPLPECTIERFAELSARIDEGRAPRASILEAAGIEEITWAHVERHWLMRLFAGDDHDLAARFGTMYGRTKYTLASFSRTESPSPASEEKRPATTVDDTLPSGVAPAPGVDDTLRDEVDPAAPSPASVAVDASTATDGTSAVPEAAAAPALGQQSPGGDAADLTLECAPDAGVRHVLPFVAHVSAVEAAPPGQRWAYFDTQTGQPLPVPVLVDGPGAMSGAQRHVKTVAAMVEEPVPQAVTARPVVTRESHVAQTPRPRIRVDAFGNTDIGQVRDGNEDSFAVLPHLGLFMVADGIGGARAGEVASRMALDCVREAFENVDMTWPAEAGTRPEQRPNASSLIAGIHRANSHILSISRRYADKAGMGTTFAGLLVLDDRLVIAHVGDSRVYRLRGRRFDLLTEDHSLLNAWVHAGVWNPEDSATFPHPNVITRAIGLEDQLEVDTRLEAPQVGDVYLICSDGLHGMLDHRELASVLLQYEDLTLAVERLIELANDRGGLDNITAVLVRITGVGRR